MFNNTTKLRIYTKLQISEPCCRVKCPGQLLIEALISIALAATLLLAIVPLFSVALLGSDLSAQNTNAVNLVRECQEAGRVILKSNYNNIYKPLGTNNKGQSNLYHPQIEGQNWVLKSGFEDILQNGTTYQRSLYIENVFRDQNGLGNIVQSGGSEDKSTQKINCEVRAAVGTIVSLTSFLTRNRNLLFSQTNWSGGPGVDYLSDDGNINFSNPGQLSLKQLATADQIYGNQFLLQSTGSIGALDTSTKKASLRFSTPTDLSVSALQIYLQTARRTNRVTYRVSIQKDSGAGLPDGNSLGSNTLKNAVSGWNRILFTPATQLQASQIYHLVVQYDSGTISTQNFIDIRNSDPKNVLRPKDQSAEANYNTLLFDGTWQTQNKQPIFLLEDNITGILGDPYQANAQLGIYDVFQSGQVITISGGDKTAKDVNFFLRKNRPQNPADSLYLSIFDQTDNLEVFSSTLVSGPQVTTTYNWYTLTFSPNFVFKVGHTYRLALKSPGSNAQRNYQILKLQTQNDPKFIPQTFDGANSKFTQSSDSGASFQDDETADLNFKFTFQGGGGGGFATHGELISNTFDSGQESAYNTISYLGNLNSQIIKIQIATNNDNLTWNFVGPDCTVNSFYTALFEKFACFDSFNQRYLRYKIILESNGVSSSVFEEIRTNYSP